MKKILAALILFGCISLSAMNEPNCTRWRVIFDGMQSREAILNNLKQVGFYEFQDCSESGIVVTIDNSINISNDTHQIIEFPDGYWVQLEEINN